jgi:hypothetical protein
MVASWYYVVVLSLSLFVCVRAWCLVYELFFERSKVESVVFVLSLCCVWPSWKPRSLSTGQI